MPSKSKPARAARNGFKPALKISDAAGIANIAAAEDGRAPPAILRMVVVPRGTRRERWPCGLIKGLVLNWMSGKQTLLRKKHYEKNDPRDFRRRRFGLHGVNAY